MTSWREILSLNTLIVGVVTSSWMDFLALTWLERRPMDPMWHEWNDPNMIQLWNFVNQKMFSRIGTIYLVHIRASLLMAQPAVLCYTWVSPLKKLFCEQRLRHDDCEGLCLDLIVEGLWRHFRRSVTTFPRIRRANCTHRFQWSQIFANLCKSRWEVCFVASCLVEVVTPHCARWASLVLAELERLLQGSSAWESRPQCHYHCQIKVQLRHIINHHKIS